MTVSGVSGYVVRWIAGLGAAVLNASLLGLLAAALLVNATLMGLPDAKALQAVTLQEPLRIYSADGVLMGEFGVQRRRPVAIDEIPPLLTKAFLVTEDSRFFEHDGIDLSGLGRAALSFARTGKPEQGGSTITMQVARNFFLSPAKTFQRKLAELLLALRIEGTLTKEEILELYLNKIFFGHRAYGVAAAAEIYYGKTLDELDIAEMAMLAGVPKAPSTNNPVANAVRARQRRDYILGRMRDFGHISEAQYQAAIAQQDQAQVRLPDVDLDAGYAAEMARREMLERFGEAAYRDGYRVTTTFDARLQRAAQAAVRKALRAYDLRHGYLGPEAKYSVAGADDQHLDALLDGVSTLPELTSGIVTKAGAKQAEVYIGSGQRLTLALSQVKWARRYRDESRMGAAPTKVTDVLAAGDLVRLAQTEQGTWQLSQRPSVAGALAVVSPDDGAVVALVGGYSFQDSEFNRAVDARRQPGSSFKPFVYAAALNRGYTPASFLRDEPFKRGGWQPKNFDGKTMGLIRMREALVLSRNLASIDLLNRAGLGAARRFVARFGFDVDQLEVGLSMALGTAEVSPLQMAGAYAVLANGGFRVIPHVISRIETSAGEVVYQANPRRACSECWSRYSRRAEDDQAFKPVGAPVAERVLDPRIAYQITSMMQDVIRQGTGHKARRLNRRDIAGKTGTTNDVRDSWFCGFQKDYVAVAWMGFDDYRPLGKQETGGEAAVAVWVDFMREALKDTPEATLDPPAHMVEIGVLGGSSERSGGSVKEWVSQETVDALHGPRPVGYLPGRTRIRDQRD
jgi:penicillin-binding protein 1A